MNKLLNILCLVAPCAYLTYGQDSAAYLRQRAEQNLTYLTSSKVLLNRVKMDDSGIEIYPQHHSYHPEFRIYWSEVPDFIEFIENRDYYTVQQLYRNKGTNHFVRDHNEASPGYYQDFPTRLRGLRIALDPGHFAGDPEEARLEGRMVRIKGGDLHQDEDIEFYEANLTSATALILKQKLEERGATVMITRPHDTGALEVNFSGWLKMSFQRDLERSLKRRDIQQHLYGILQDAYKDTLKESNRYYLFQFYKFLDFRQRSKKINDFQPNVTFIMHYNASETGRPKGTGRYITPVLTNYSMAFVPGSFEYNELVKSDQKVDFVRLLLSTDMDNSMRLAEKLLKKHHELLGVPPIPPDSLQRMKDVVIQTPYEGVFSRNLYLTRSIRGTVVYGESLFQDNVKEAVDLSKKDYTVTDDRTGVEYKTSARCALVAQAYYEALVDFLEENRESATAYDAHGKLLSEH